VGVETITSVAPNNTPGTKTGIGAQYTAVAAKKTDPIIIGTYNGTAYVKTGAGGADGDWTPLGSATSFATGVEVIAGTDTAKALNAKALRDGSLKAPTSTPANDEDHLVILNAQGQIDAGFLSIKGLTYRGNLDMTSPYTAITGLAIGDFGTANPGGSVDSSWAGFTGGEKVEQGDLVFWDGTNWHLVERGIDATAYVTKSGSNAIIKDMVMTWAAPDNPGTTIIDGGDPAKSKIDNCMIDEGTY
jgi:hypothetical protein